MPLHLYDNVYASGAVPTAWEPILGGTIKYPVRNGAVLRHLRKLRPGRWRKVIKQGEAGDFEHASGQVAGVKYYPNEVDS